MKAKAARATAVPHPPTQPASSPASWIAKTPGVCCGDACIRNTRITVSGLVEWRNLGLSDAGVIERNPDLAPADVQAAWDYYEQNREEIDQAIQEDAEA